MTPRGHLRQLGFMIDRLGHKLETHPHLVMEREALKWAFIRLVEGSDDTGLLIKADRYRTETLSRSIEQ